MRALILIATLISGTARAEVPDVVTDIAPVHSLVSSVMGDLGQPRLLLGADSDPHTFQMRPSQARALSQAGLLIWMGPDLTPWLGRTLKTMAPDARSLALLDAPDPPMRLEGEDGDGHDHGVLDPHAWLDPLNAVFYLNVIARELAQMDPANAATYALNATTTAAGLQDMHNSLTPHLAPLKQVTLIAGHDAFGYLLHRYDLHLTGSLSDSAGNAPGVAHLKTLQAEITAGNRTICVLIEPGTSAEIILSMFPATPPKVVELDPMGRRFPPGPALYESMMRDLAGDLATCAQTTN